MPGLISHYQIISPLSTLVNKQDRLRTSGFGCRHTKKSSTSATSLSTKRAIVNHLKMAPCTLSDNPSVLSSSVHCFFFSTCTHYTHSHQSHSKAKVPPSQQPEIRFCISPTCNHEWSHASQCYTLDIDNSSSNINSRIHSEEDKEKCHNKIHNDEPCNTSLIAFTTHHTARW